jgi:acyl-CoA thioesterase-1
MYKSVRILSILGALLILGACGQPASETGDTKSEPLATRETSAEAEAATASHPILFFGDSITAGYGLEDGLAFPALIQEKIEEAGWRFEVVNAGLSGDTSAGGLRRIDWLLREPVDVLILELGGNDGLRGTSPEVTKQNLQAIINQVRLKNTDTRIILAGMQIPPNLGQAHTRRFQEIFPELAESNDAVLIPFLLKDVGGIRSLNQTDGIHPTAEGHRIIAETVWDTLKPILAELAANDESCLAAGEEENGDCLIDMSGF